MKTRLLILGIVFLACMVPALTFAQAKGGFVPLTQGADFQKMFGISGGSGNANDLTTFLNSGFKMVLSIGAIMAVLRIAWAGYQYMSSDAWGEKSHAKEILGDVVIGLLLLLGSYLILYQINPDILNLKINGVTPNGQSAAQQLVGGTQPL